MSRLICIGVISLDNYILNIQLTDGASLPKRKTDNDSIWCIRLTAHPILSRRYHWIRQIHTKYPPGVSIGQPDSPSNIVRRVPLDQADTHRIFIGCVHQLAQ
jgi:hypothetical protein